MDLKSIAKAKQYGQVNVSIPNGKISFNKHGRTRDAKVYEIEDKEKLSLSINES